MAEPYNLNQAMPRPITIGYIGFKQTSLREKRHESSYDYPAFIS